MKEKDKDRRLQNWIDSFLRYSDVFASPKLYRKWAAIGLISSVLEKKVWTRTRGSNLYPNLYVVLVGPPGVGKSAILSKAELFLRAMTDICVAPSSLTTASLVDTVNLAQRKLINRAGVLVSFNSLQVVASELGVFLPAYDPAFMNTLTKLYDGELYEERRRTGKVNHIRIENPQLSILGGTTPSYLNSFLPDGAWDQGFTSRTIFIYSNQPINISLFGEKVDEEYNDSLHGDLVHDLKVIAALYGKMDWTPEAMVAITEWNVQGLKPIPEHGKLAHYNSRRLAHVIKLCIIASVSRSNDFEINLDDFNLAREWLLEAEDIMPEIFKMMGTSGDARAIEDTWYAVYKLYETTNKPIGEHIVVNFLKDRVPSHSISKIIEVMIRSHQLKQTIVNGIPAYIPAAKN